MPTGHNKLIRRLIKHTVEFSRIRRTRSSPAQLGWSRGNLQKLTGPWAARQFAWLRASVVAAGFRLSRPSGRAAAPLAATGRTLDPSRGVCKTGGAVGTKPQVRGLIPQVSTFGSTAVERPVHTFPGVLHTPRELSTGPVDNRAWSRRPGRPNLTRSGVARGAARTCRALTVRCGRRRGKVALR